MGILRSTVRRVDKGAPRFSYWARRAINHHTAADTPSFEDYLAKRKRKRSKPVAAPRDPFPEEEELKNGGDLRTFVERAEERIRGADAPADYCVRFARAAVAIGEPERLLNFPFSEAVSRSISFRRHYLAALVSLGDVEKAYNHAQETLAMGDYNAQSLIQIIGDCYLFSNKNDILLSAASALFQRFDNLAQNEITYVLNIVLNRAGLFEASRLAAHRPVKKGSAGDWIYRSNVARHTGDYPRQMKLLNKVLDQHQLRSLSLKDTNKPFSAFNIVAPAAPPVRGPLVTVLMSAFNSSGTIGAALEGLSHQDYRDLDILVVDDFSTDNTEAVVRKCAERDQRIRYMRADRKAGTYHARNIGLREGRGEFFTVNDSDDWAHPQKISSLVRTLEETPGAVAVQSKLFRVSKTFGVKPRLEGYAHTDQSSLLFRRAQILSEMGPYEEVRYGADSEFSERLRALYSPDAFVHVAAPLLIADWSPTSASGSALTGITDGGTMSPQRLKYRREYRARHGEIRSKMTISSTSDSMP